MRLSCCARRRPALGGPEAGPGGQWRAAGEPRSVPVYCFPEEAERSIGSWAGAEQRGSVQKHGRQGVCEFFRLPGLLPAADVQKVLARAKEHASYRTDADSVDGQPTFEYYPLRDGQWLDEDLQSLLAGFIEERLLPYVRERYRQERCAVADVLVRRYLPGERRAHAVHFDGHALVTAVLGLSDPSEYQGGLYLQPEAHASSRLFFRIEPGDLVLHSFDLQHGVFLWSGVRYSLVFWIKDSAESVAHGTAPWYDPLVETGDADALYNVAQDHELGICGRELDIKCAMRLYEESARLGHHFAQHNLSKLLFMAHEHDEQPEGREKAASWMRAAAEQGFALAQKGYALALASGQGVEEDCVQAADWMRRAAEQLELEAAFYMGDFFLRGCGLPRDPKQAASWYACSAEAGLPQAQCALGLLFLEGKGVAKDPVLAERWLSRAAEQGNKKARRRLAALRGGA